MQERIIDNGTVITQLLFNRKGDKQSFTIRNGIVAGMTLGTGLFEADLTDNEQTGLNVLDVTEQTIDTFITNGGLLAATLSVALLGLEMKCLAKQLSGRSFARR